ncbi:MAG: DUF1761 domain-containing protein [Deltaproteobacteria bacterium]|nr:DUF1761 domain-containing protein [Deltaproteobacteria bacterium]MBT4526810.1 DUF1761 domain-containing protein [Deltaproteobacteria bacterium]
MDWIDNLRNVDYIAVAVATVSSYVLGFVWYHWAVFGKTWAKLLGMTKDEADKTEGLAGAFIMSLIGGLAKTIFMAVLMVATGTTSAFGGVVFGGIVALTLISTSIAYHNGFARVSSKLTMIDAAHDIVELAVIGAIIGMFA